MGINEQITSVGDRDQSSWESQENCSDHDLELPQPLRN